MGRSIVAAFAGLGYGLGRYVLPVDGLSAAVQQTSTIGKTTGNGIILGFSRLVAHGTYQFVRAVW